MLRVDLSWYKFLFLECFVIFPCSQVGLEIALGTSKVCYLLLGSLPTLFKKFPICHLPNLWWEELTWHVPYWWCQLLGRLSVILKDLFRPQLLTVGFFSFEISPAVGRCTSDTFLASLLLCGAWDSAGKGLSPLHQSHQQYPQWDYNTGMNRKL